MRLKCLKIPNSVKSDLEHVVATWICWPAQVQMMYPYRVRGRGRHPDNRLQVLLRRVEFLDLLDGQDVLAHPRDHPGRGGGFPWILVLVRVVFEHNPGAQGRLFVQVGERICPVGSAPG